MSFQPKREKTGGRTAGTPNRTTKEQKEIFSNFLGEHSDTALGAILELIQSDESHERTQGIKFFLDIAKHIIPKASEIEITEPVNPYDGIPDHVLEKQLLDLENANTLKIKFVGKDDFE